MAKEATTIYIDDSAISVLVARGMKAEKWANMPLESGLVKDGVVLNEDAVANKVKELWQNEKIGAGRVIAGISGINCLYRSLTLPEVPKDILPEAVKREASRVLGVPLEQLYLSWQALPSVKGEVLIYLAASPRNSVDAMISTLRKAGLNPYLMDLKPLALARTTTEPSAIIIDLQLTSFDIIVVSERIPQVVRSLPLAQDALLEKKIPIIREELNRAITFYNSSHMDKPIKSAVPILVCGELAGQEDAWKLLMGRQQHPVQALPSPIEMAGNFVESQYMTNIGLALKELALEKGAAYSQVNLNVLPEAYISKRRPLSEILLIPTIIVGIALVAFGVFLNLNASEDTATLQSELAGINQKMISQHVQASDIAALGKEVSSLEGTAAAFSTTLDTFKIGRDTTNGDLGEINKASGLKLESINYSSNAITVKGSAPNEHAVFRYAEDLRNSKRFALVVVSSMDKQDNQMGFTLTLTK